MYLFKHIPISRSQSLSRISLSDSRTALSEVFIRNGGHLHKTTYHVEISDFDRRHQWHNEREMAGSKVCK